jgi:hypothetical protein
MDADSERYALDVAAAIAGLLGSQLTGVYLHGSAVLGGFDPRRSDIDILAVSDGPMTPAQQAAVAEALSEARLPCPAQGLEMSIVTLYAAQHPTAAPPFELHLTTAAADSKIVDGHQHGGDPDLVLHFAVCRSAGRLLGPGLDAGEVFAPVADELVLTQLADELRWGAANAPGEYAVLNACRAWQFAADRVLVSKVNGGQWALGRVTGADRALISTALDRQRCTPAAELDAGTVSQFVEQTLGRLADALS